MKFLAMLGYIIVCLCGLIFIVVLLAILIALIMRLVDCIREELGHEKRDQTRDN